jgi:hypothetical protein
MSSSIDVFVASCNLEAVLALVKEVINADLKKVVTDYGDLYEAYTCRIPVTVLENHGLVDDQAIQFSAYPIQVGFYLFGGGPDTSLYPLTLEMANLTASAIHGRLGYQCIVVENVQVLLKEFGDGERGRDRFDGGSGQ